MKRIAFVLFVFSVVVYHFFDNDNDNDNDNEIDFSQNTEIEKIIPTPQKRDIDLEMGSAAKIVSNNNQMNIEESYARGPANLNDKKHIKENNKVQKITKYQKRYIDNFLHDITVMNLMYFYFKNDLEMSDFKINKIFKIKNNYLKKQKAGQDDFKRYLTEKYGESEGMDFLPDWEIYSNHIYQKYLLQIKGLMGEENFNMYRDRSWVQGPLAENYEDDLVLYKWKKL